MITRLWPSLPLSARAALPALPGVYICRGWWGWGRARYVGQSGNLRRRWCQHHRLRQLAGHTRIYYRVMPGASVRELRRVEAMLIAYLQPALNGRRRWTWKRAWRWMLAH